MSAIPVVILHGFLGSGKTTLLRKVLALAIATDNVPAVVVNDMSELDVDGVLVANVDAVGKDNDQFITISGDSISTPSGLEQLDEALSDMLRKETPPWLLIETSGSSHPLPLVSYFKTQANYRLTSVITLVDTIWLRDDFDAATTLIPRWQKNVERKERGIENLLVEQIMFSNKVLLTKADKVAPEVVKKVAQAIHPINPYAEIISTSWGNASLGQLSNDNEYNYFLVEQLINELESQVNLPLTLSGKASQKIVAQVIKDDRPFHPMRLWQVCHHHLTKGVFRSKGFFWLPTKDDMSLLWSQANGSVGLEVVGYWRVAAMHDENQRLTLEQMALMQQKINEVDSRFGDRRCRLTVIGQRDEVNLFVDMLNDCFLTEQEILQWRRGEKFEDPWPTNIALNRH